MFINTTLAHGRSAIQPATILPKAFERPMIENTRGTGSEWYVIFNDLINSDRKKNGIKKPEKKKLIKNQHLLTLANKNKKYTKLKSTLIKESLFS